jgi:hypothetical protein
MPRTRRAVASSDDESLATATVAPAVVRRARLHHEREATLHRVLELLIVVYLVPSVLLSVHPQFKLDEYEGENYVRVRVTLATGIQAWVYCASPLLLKSGNTSE